MRVRASMIDGIFDFGAMQVRQTKKACCVFKFGSRSGTRDRIKGRSGFGRSLDRVRIDAIWTNCRRVVPKTSAHHDHFTWPPSLLSADTSSFL